MTDTAATTGQTEAVNVLLGTFVDRDGNLVPDAIDGSSIPGFPNGFQSLLTKFQVRGPRGGPKGRFTPTKGRFTPTKGRFTPTSRRTDA